MKFGIVLVASLLLLGTTACSSKWPPQVRQEALEVCTLGVANSIQDVWPPNPRAQLEQATRICACAVDKAEKVNSSPPSSALELMMVLRPHLNSCR